MKSQIRTRTLPHLLGTTGALALALCGAARLTAEQPAVAPAPGDARVSLARTTAQLEPPAPLTPEPPQASANSVLIKDDLFAGTEKFAKNATEANEVNMDPDALSLVDGPDAKRAHRTLLNVVHHYEYDKPGMYNMAEVDEFRHKLDGPDWHCSVHSRDLKSGESTDICSRRRAPDMIERAIITVEPKELTFIHQITRGNGEGGSLDPGAMPAFSMVPGISSGNFAVLGAEMQADLLASAAELRAGMPGLLQGAHDFKSADLGWNRMFSPGGKMRNFQLSPEELKNLNKLTKQLRPTTPSGAGHLDQ